MNRLSPTQRISQLVPSKTRRYDLRAFAYTEITRHGDIDLAVISMVREKQTSLLIAREIVMWIAGRYKKGTEK